MAFDSIRLCTILLLLVPLIYAYPQYRDEIPNGLRSVEVDERVVEALGHENKHGGGALNIFGNAFKDAGFEWTRKLCMADTDGDGESNGLELGDPCCIWKVGLTPMRQWGLSHPAIAKSKTNLNFHYNTTCLSKEGDKEFWKFYFDKETGFKYKTFSEDFSDWVGKQRKVLNETEPGFYNYLQLLNPAKRDEEDYLRSTKDLFTTLVIGCTFITLFIFIFSHRCGCFGRKTLSVKDHMWLIFAAYIFTDWMSGNLHVILDNPVMNTWPVIGPEAKAFQGHHYDPTAVARGNWMNFLREHHSLVFLVMISYIILKPSSPGLMLFSLHFLWQSHVMMASHRWSHTNPKYLSPMVRTMQRWGIVMSVKHHSMHHASYDCNFCIFSGKSNIVLNQLVHVIHWRSPLWVVILVICAVIPILVADHKSVRHWLMNIVESPFRLIYEATCKKFISSDNNNYSTATTNNSTTLPSSLVKGKAGRGIVDNKKDKLKKKGETFELYCCGSNNINNPRCRKYVACMSYIIGFASTVVIMYGLVVSGQINWKGTGFARFLIAIHVLCMSSASLIFIGVGITAYSWNVFDETDSRYIQRKESLRSVHRFANTFSGLLFLIGFVVILLHFWIKEHTLLHDKSVHTLLGLTTLIGVFIQIVTGLSKIKALKSKKKKLKFHGKTGWYTFVLMYLTVNSGVAESGFFINLIATQMLLQFMLFVNIMLLAFATKRFPAFKIKCINPIVYLVNEWLYIAPWPISTLCRKFICCCKGFRGGDEVGDDEDGEVVKPSLD